MKLLIIVNSSHEHPYDKFMEMQMKTWDTIDHPHVETMYFHGSAEENHWDGKVYKSTCPHGYYFQHWKFKQALDAVWHWDWNMIFKTHSSSYVDKKKLYELANTLPLIGLYGGWQLGQGLPKIMWEGKEIPQHCVAGNGVFMSRDIADILRKELPEGKNIEEDVLQGRILQLHNIDVSHDICQRVDLLDINKYRPSFHYRIKTNDRLQDVETMRLLHEKITQE